MSPQILLVDDEAPLRELLSLYFRKKGFLVTTAMSVAEAKAADKAGTFDLAILDVDLAGENGLDLLDHFTKQRPNMPVLIFTGLHADKELVEKALARGARGVMGKTRSLDDLLAEVRRQLRSSGQTAP